MSSVSYPVNVGGKPYHSWPAFIIVTFEMTILFAAISAVFGMLALNGLPMPYHPVFNVPRFAFATKDRFFLIVFASDKKYDAGGDARVSGGSESARHLGGAQLAHAQPPTISPLGLLAVLALAGCRQDMHDQPRFKPLAKSDFYADLRSAREPVEGTVARGQLHEDTLFLHRKDRQQSWRLHAVSRDRGSAGARARALQHLLRALPLARGRRQWNDSGSAVSRASRRPTTSNGCAKRRWAISLT